MKGLNLNAYGVVEMSSAEMREKDGGMCNCNDGRWGNASRFAGNLIGHIFNAVEAAASHFVDFWSGEGGDAVRQASLAAGRG